MRGREGPWSQGDPKRVSRLGKIRAQGGQERFHRGARVIREAKVRKEEDFKGTRPQELEKAKN